MKEKELRLALVYYGGVSLAIYQHGVNVEVLNLVRASKAYHAPRNLAERQSPGHRFPQTRYMPSTGEVYFDLLKQIGQLLDLRVVVDVISGSSAGGINGIVLARAIVHDLDISPLADMWFSKADILKLMAPEARAGRLSKWYVTPFLQLAFARLEKEGLLPSRADPEFRRQLATFIRSRWFKPPLDGPHFSNLLLDGLLAMQDEDMSASTLLPPETRLDLMITVTDYHGAEIPIFLHDPPMVCEREHRQMLRFQAVSSTHGLVASDFSGPNIPSLAFAGRATASYPGAFPPAQVREIDELVAKRGLDWPGREAFLDTNFSYRLQPDEVVLLDGGILNNKPLRAAIDAIRTHTAYREVDRRLVYIDPHPDWPNPEAGLGMPGFFTTLRGALSDLPRHDPIYEELEEINRFNDQIRRLKAIAQISQPHVEALIEQATNGGLAGPFTEAQLRYWRLTSTNLLASSALVYNAWWRLLVLEAADVIAGLVARVCAVEPLSQQAQWIKDVIEAWCELEGMFPRDYKIPETVSVDAELPAFARFIVDFGVPYKMRRVSTVLRHINAIYRMGLEEIKTPIDFDAIDDLRRRVSACLRSLYIIKDPSFLLKLPTTEIKPVFRAEKGRPRPEPAHYARRNRATISGLIRRIGEACDLAGGNEELDEILSSPELVELDPELRRSILVAYLGWAYRDIVVLPAMNALGLQSNAFEEILVDRISPQDATSVRTATTGGGTLRGAAAIGFGGFLSRAARENDYLWGRIHGIDRLIDIVASTVDPALVTTVPNFAALKKRAFQAALDEEEQRLTSIPEVVAAVRAVVEKL